MIHGRVPLVISLLAPGIQTLVAVTMTLVWQWDNRHGYCMSWEPRQHSEGKVPVHFTRPVDCTSTLQSEPSLHRSLLARTRRPPSLHRAGAAHPQVPNCIRAAAIRRSRSRTAGCPPYRTNKLLLLLFLAQSPLLPYHPRISKGAS
jgi:hypothetical protein